MKTKWFLPLAIFGLFLAAGVPPLAGQVAQDQTQPKSAGEAKLVTVYATVRDNHGKIAADLKQGDFALTEDGHPEAITYFARESDLPLTLGLLVDTSGSQRLVIGDERDQGYKFLDHMLFRDQDRAFLIHFDHEVELLQSLTASREKLQAALQLLDSPELRQAGQDDPDSGGQNGHGGAQLYDAIYLASNELMRKQQGRKVLVVLTDGVDHGSKETLDDALEAAQRADAIVYSIFSASHEAAEHQGGFGHHGGTGGGWPGGGGGGDWPGGGGGGGYHRHNPEGQRPDGKKILTRISTETGGRMFEITKKLSVSEIYSQIEEELRNQYVLGYPREKAEEGPTYHKIAVTTKSKDLTVHARDGYYADQ